MSSTEEYNADNNIASSWHRHLHRLGLSSVTTLLRQKQVWESGRGSKDHLVSQDGHRLPENEQLVEHTVGSGETLLQIADRYYGSNTRDKWLVIYEQNRGVIGAQPAFIQEGQILKIPVLGKY